MLRVSEHIILQHSIVIQPCYCSSSPRKPWQHISGLTKTHLYTCKGAVEQKSLSVRRIPLNTNHIVDTEPSMDEKKVTEICRAQTNVAIVCETRETSQAAECFTQHLSLDVLGRPKRKVDVAITGRHHPFSCFKK